MKKRRETKLTPAAREALDELVDEYRTQILVGAEQFASDNYSSFPREISVSNIFDSLSKSKNTTQKKSFSDRFMEIYQIIGILITFFGAVLIFREINQSTEMRIGGYSVLVGLALNLLTFVYFKFSAVRRLFDATLKTRKSADDSVDLPLRYVKIWREIELAIRELVALTMGESNAKEPIFRLVSKLRDSKVITTNDATQLKRLISIRNKIVHEKPDLQISQVEVSLLMADKMLQKIKNATPKTG